MMNVQQDVRQGFGLVLKQWRAKVHISQEELAFRAGLHRTYISGVERGARNASLQTISKLAKALDISLSEMFEPLGQFPKSAKGNSAPDFREALGSAPACRRFPEEASSEEEKKRERAPIFPVKMSC
jgi:transcriptional regulator with XRE-family HTH domain